jgi:general secretion pathway protein D
LQGAKDARLLANPNAVVLENEEAIFEKVQEIPYQQLTQTQQGGSIGTTSFKKAGITLHVSPKISVDGLIRMNVNPEVSRLVGFTPGDNQPIIDTSSAQTVLTVANKQTFAIGGLRTRNDAAEFNGIPYLKDLNVVGRLFRSRDIDVREGELVVFISPEIESYAEEPNCREKIALETVRCRLDQIPEAEGCPPCCRRLPCEPCDAAAPTMDGGPAGGNATSAGGAPTEAAEHELPPNNQSTPTDGASLKQPGSLEPLSARRIPSAEFQFGAAGKNEQVRALMAEGRLRRLPIVDSTSAQVAASALVTPGMFSAPPAMPVSEIDNGPQTAKRELSEPGYR